MNFSSVLNVALRMMTAGCVCCKTINNSGMRNRSRYYYHVLGSLKSKFLDLKTFQLVKLGVQRETLHRKSTFNRKSVILTSYKSGSNLTWKLFLCSLFKPNVQDERTLSAFWLEAHKLLLFPVYHTAPHWLFFNPWQSLLIETLDRLISTAFLSFESMRLF